jgi:hypothetical protein
MQKTAAVRRRVTCISSESPSTVKDVLHLTAPGVQGQAAREGLAGTKSSMTSDGDLQSYFANCVPQTWKSPTTSLMLVDLSFLVCRSIA